MKASNRLNDLSGKEWLPTSRSVFINGVSDASNSLSWERLESGSVSVMSKPAARSTNKKSHPATFPESDARMLVRLFTREGGKVLDPFIGSGSTAIACIEERRCCTGFDLYTKWTDLAHERISEIEETLSVHPDQEFPIKIVTGDSLDCVGKLESESQNFILTSPPYWGILSKTDHKANTERASNGLDTNYGNNPNDLSQITCYNQFLETLGEHFKQWCRVLVKRGYVAVIVSDFRHGQKYYPFHAHISEQLEKTGFTTQGMIIIVQDNKRLYPYGFPTTYVPNICNQFVVVARKL